MRANSVIEYGFNLISGGTDNHLLMVDMRPFGPGRGIFIEKALEAAEISVNKQPIPNDPAPPYYPSGVRIGTPVLTARGMKEDEMRKAGKLIAKIFHAFSAAELPEDKTLRAQAVKDFVATLDAHPLIAEVKQQVKDIALQFPVPGM